MLIIALIWAVVSMTDHWNLSKLGWAFAFLSIVSFLFIPLGRMMVQTWVMAKEVPKGPYRVVTMWLGVIAVIANAVWIPFPHRIGCQGTVQPGDQTMVYTQVAGRVAVRHERASWPQNELDNRVASREFHPESRVARSEFSMGVIRTSETPPLPARWKSPSSPLVLLENPWLEDQYRVAQHRHKQLELEAVSLKQAAYQESSRIDRLPAIRTLVSIAEKKSRQVEKELNSLSVSPSLPGQWVPMELPIADSLDGPSCDQRGYTVNDLESYGRWLPAGTPIGFLAAMDSLSVEVLLPVSQLSDVRVGMPARVRLDQLPGCVFPARIVEVSDAMATTENHMRTRSPAKASSNNEGSDGRSLVSVTLAIERTSPATLAIGGTAEVVIWSTPKSLYQHAIQIAGATFGPNESLTSAQSR